MSTRASLDRTPSYTDIEQPDKILAGLTGSWERTWIHSASMVSIHVPCLWALWGDGGLPVRRSRLRCGRGVVAGAGLVWG